MHLYFKLQDITVRQTLSISRINQDNIPIEHTYSI